MERDGDTFEGPTESCLDVARDVRVEKDLPAISLRLVDRAGRPVVSDRLELSMWCRGPVGGGGMFGSGMTDASGRLTIDMISSSIERLETHVEISVVAGPENSWRPSRRVRLDFHPALRIVLDLGDVTFDELPLLVAGTVRDHHGSPVETATEVQILRDDGDDSGDGSVVEPDENGEFVVYDEALPGYTRVGVRRPFHPSGSYYNPRTATSLDVLFAPGETDLTLTLEPPDD